MGREPKSLEATRQDMLERRADFDRQTSFRYGIWAREDHALLGEALVMSAAEGRWELGYWLTVPAQGHGYALEASKTLLSAFWSTELADAVDLLCDLRNERSTRLAIRLGAEKVGEEDEPALLPERGPVDVLGRWRVSRPRSARSRPERTS